MNISFTYTNVRHVQYLGHCRGNIWKLLEQSCSSLSSQSLLSPTAFSYASQYIARYEEQGIGRFTTLNMYFIFLTCDTCHRKVNIGVQCFRSSVGKYVQLPRPGGHHVIRLAVLSHPSWLLHLLLRCLVCQERFPRYERNSHAYMSVHRSQLVYTFEWSICHVKYPF